MNSAHFEGWWGHQLLANLPAGADIVLDNAPYHNRRKEDSVAPRSCTRKADMVLWLAKNNISHDPTMLKAQLYQLVMRNKPAVKYVVD